MQKQRVAVVRAQQQGQVKQPLCGPWQSPCCVAWLIPPTAQGMSFGPTMWLPCYWTCYKKR